MYTVVNKWQPVGPWWYSKTSLTCLHTTPLCCGERWTQAGIRGSATGGGCSLKNLEVNLWHLSWDDTRHFPAHQPQPAWSWKSSRMHRPLQLPPFTHHPKGRGADSAWETAKSAPGAKNAKQIFAKLIASQPTTHASEEHTNTHTHRLYLKTLKKIFGKFWNKCSLQIIFVCSLSFINTFASANFDLGISWLIFDIPSTCVPVIITIVKIIQNLFTQKLGIIVCTWGLYV